jgi:hypothetical protein
MKNPPLYLLLFLCVSFGLKAQEKQKAPVRLSFNLAVINRTAYLLTSYLPLTMNAQVNPESQLTGTGVNGGFMLYIPKLGIGITGSETFRYDHIFYAEVSYQAPGFNGYGENKKGIIVDYNLDISKHFNFKTWSLFVEVGASLMNTGTEYMITPAGSLAPREANSRFNASNFKLGANIKNLFITLGTYYTSNAYNYIGQPKILMPEARIGYSFKVF